MGDFQQAGKRLARIMSIAARLAGHPERFLAKVSQISNCVEGKTPVVLLHMRGGFLPPGAGDTRNYGEVQLRRLTHELSGESELARVDPADPAAINPPA